MAYTSSIDELNNLQTEQDKQKIRKYFEEMDLEPEEIEKRINTANGINNLYLILFLLMSASATAGDSVIDDNEYWNDFLTRGYNDVLSENGYDTDDPMISNRIDETVAEVLNTTYEHIAQSYYLSHDRAVMIASNDTNAFANYEQHIQAIKAGYTRKRWMAMKDKKVRHTHVWADGQEVDIQKPFIVGGYEMLFPLDQSLGADAKEVVNCRCVCMYLGKTGNTNNSTNNSKPELLQNNLESGIIFAQNHRSIIDLDLQFFGEETVLKKQSENQLRRGIISLEKQIEKHKSYIENPEKHDKTWATKTEIERQGLLKHWQKEIKTAEYSIERRVEELERRGHR